MSESEDDKIRTASASGYYYFSSSCTTDTIRLALILSIFYNYNNTQGVRWEAWKLHAWKNTTVLDHHYHNYFFIREMDESGDLRTRNYKIIIRFIFATTATSFATTTTTTLDNSYFVPRGHY